MREASHVIDRRLLEVHRVDVVLRELGGDKLRVPGEGEEGRGREGERRRRVGALLYPCGCREKQDEIKGDQGRSREIEVDETRLPTWPSVGSISPVSSFRKVDLPAPD